MLIYKRNLHRRNQTSILIWGRENRAISKSDGRTDGQTNRRTYISIYRVASLLKNMSRLFYEALQLDLGYFLDQKIITKHFVIKKNI